ncbi:unnamed protein product [Parnassius apollo]|uniref:(apollo) hypothetical protein n=1 Tax=Parnassius apollo TaxID=110799 RepID=A0A8S3WYK4_PARAO|nr:unnamed protein product [Parnassius apollo]
MSSLNFPFEFRSDEKENKKLRKYFIGTTWTQELVWLLVNDLDYVKAAAEPLTSRYTFIEFPMFMNKDSVSELKSVSKHNEEWKKLIDYFSKPGSEVIAEKPSPRFIKTHVPMSLLPPHLLDIAKVVYVARDPRDVAVSFFHHNRLFKMTHFVGDFKTYWHFFVRNMVLWTPFFDHLKEAWDLRNHPNLLFLFYEDLSKDLPRIVRLVADFLGKEYNDEQIADLCSHLHFENFKNNPSVNMDELKELDLYRPNFIRKGKAGGWREYFDDEMTQEAERWIMDNLKDTDLRFPSAQ